jgi:beta-phosphoglucomutase
MVDHKYRAAIFDLDGVIVDTAKYHYLAWKNLAKNLGFDFSERENERLKGVSRIRSLEILLEIGEITLDEDAKNRLAAKKNQEYVEYIREIEPEEMLAGSEVCLNLLRDKGVGIGLGSASKNATLILEKLQIGHLFDVIIDGNQVTNAKPDPEVFLLGARELGVEPADCVVFEDAEAGLQAARAAGMFAVGVGEPDVLKSAHFVISGLHAFNIESLF